MKKRMKRLAQSRSGFILPVVIIGLAVSAVGVSYFVSRFSSAGSREFVAEKFRSVNFTTIHSGMEWAKNRMLRPDDPSLRHVWSEGFTENLTMVVGGRSVDVQIEDLSVDTSGGGGGGGGGTCMEGKFRTKSVLSKNIVNVDVGDVDRDGIVGHTDTFVLDGVKKVFRLSHWPVHRILAVQKNGSAYQKKFYSCQNRNGWFSVKEKTAGTIITVAYEYSTALDVLTANNSMAVGQKCGLYKNTGNFSFTETLPFNISGNTRDAAYGDFDDDGDLDVALVFANLPVRVYVNDGAGNYDSGTNIDTVSRDSSACVWADMDFDGKPELIVANRSNNESRIYKFSTYSSGVPVFTCAWNKVISANTTSVDAGDFDGDGDADLVFADRNGKVYVYENIYSFGKRVFVMDATSNRLKILDAYDLYPVDEIGIAGGAVSFSNASGLAVDDSYVYICDTGNSRVKILTKGTLKTQTGISGGFNATRADNGAVVWINAVVPTGVTTDATYIYVCDSINGNVIRLAKTFDASVYTTAAAMVIPNVLLAQDVKLYKTSIAVSAKGSNRVFVYDKTSLKLVAESTLASMGMDGDGSYLYSVDTVNKQLVKFDFVPPLVSATAVDVSYSASAAGAGTFTNPYTGTTLATAGLADPTYVSLGGGSLFITNKSTNKVEKWNAATMTPEWCNASDVLTPTGIAADEAGSSIMLKEQEWISGVDYEVRYAEWADVDSDGDLDIVIVGAGSVAGTKPTHAVLRNDGYNKDNAVFTKSWSENLDKEDEGFALGDVDGDGVDDMLLARTNQSADTAPALSFYKGAGGGSYTSNCDSSLQTDADYRDLSASRIRLADLNNDGIRDVIVSAQDTVAFSNETAGFGVYSNTTETKPMTRIKVTYKEKSNKVAMEGLMRVGTSGLVLDMYSVNIN